MLKLYKTLSLSLLFLINFNTTVSAQSVEEEVMKPINLLFEAMEKADTSLLTNVFAKNVIMKVVSKKGVKNESVAGFITQIANKAPNKPKWIEKLYDTEIRVDGHLAHVWTGYSFYVGEKFSHCGVDSFALIKMDGVWKIVYIMDTRRINDCEE